MQTKNETITLFFKHIASGDIVAGQRMSQAQLSKSLDTSLSPLREALKILEHRGFIRIIPQSGIEVCTTSLQLIRNSFQMRRMIEGFAVRIFLKHDNKERIKESLAAHLSLKDRLINEEAINVIQSEFCVLDEKLHAMIVESTHNSLLHSAHEENTIRGMLIMFDSTPFNRNSILASINEHIDILEAMVVDDADLSAIKMDAHIVQAMNRAMGA